MVLSLNFFIHFKDSYLRLALNSQCQRYKVSILNNIKKYGSITYLILESYWILGLESIKL